MRMFDATEVIRRKRDGGVLSEPMIRWVVDAYTRGAVSEEQMAALAMAIFIRGMNREETAQWTAAMTDSGKTLDFSKLGKRTVDKHSTGGVGDKITLPLAPLVASFGVAVPQLSGRGLGHTGGTLDKMESIAGWRANLSEERMWDILKGPAGAVICAASEGLAPADRKLYALRDVTGTVDSIPLIASSIMSKKIAEGTGGLVLDVKVGSGAFMKDLESATKLAEVMVDLGSQAGLATSAYLTNMNTPLGFAVGNALEVAEAVQVLEGGGPQDVVELVEVLATEMLALAGVKDADVRGALQGGRAMDQWREMVCAQGGDPDAPLPTAKHTEVVRAGESGYVASVDAWGIGVAAWRLGAGRAQQGDRVQAGAGIELHVKPGGWVDQGTPLLTLHTDTENRIPRAMEALEGSIVLTPAPPEPEPLILGKIEERS